MHILILNWRDIKHPLAGGAEISLFSHAKYWQKKGAKIMWISSYFNGAEEEEVISNIRIIRMGSHYTVHIKAMIYFFTHLRNTFDIIIDSYHFLPFFTPFYFKKNRIILVINEPAKNVWFENINFPLNLIGYYCERFFFLPYKKVSVITSSESIVKELESFGIDRERIFVIYHGTENTNIKNSKKEKSLAFIYLSQLSPDKGIEDALDAFAMIHKMHPNIQLWVVGKARDKKYEYKVRKKSKQLGISRNVIFYGYVTQKEKFELLAKAFVLIHPSMREGWGLNIIEANSKGVPAIGYNVTGLKDSILNMKTGLLTSQNTPKDLALCMNLLIENKTLYNTLSKSAREWSKNFTWEKAGEESWNLIKVIYGKK